MIRVLAIAAVAAAVVSLASPVQAAPGVTISPSPVIIRGDRSTWTTVSVDFGGADLYYADADMRPASGSGNGYESATLTDPDKDGIWTGRVQFDAYDPVGRWRIETTAIPNDASGTYPGPTGSFTIRGQSRVSLRAKPAAVRKGQVVKLTGTLSVTKYGGYSTRGASGKWVKIYWRAKPSGKWKYVTRAKTGSLAQYTAKAKPKKGGYWQAVWSGAGYYLKASSKSVKVRVR